MSPVKGDLQREVRPPFENQRNIQFMIQQFAEKYRLRVSLDDLRRRNHPRQTRNDDEDRQTFDREAARGLHLGYIDRRWEAVAAVAWKEYVAHGRGALLLHQVLTVALSGIVSTYLLI